MSNIQCLDVPRILRYLEVIETNLPNYPQGKSKLFDTLHSVLCSGGKRIRPILTLMSCEVVCGEYDPAIPIAVAYELAHNASLVQDDLIDHSDLRHKTTTVHAKYGIAYAILVSDILIFEIFTKLAEYKRRRISQDQLLQLLRFLGESSKETVMGEILEQEPLTTATVDTYLKMAQLKTGSLIAACAASGAIVGGASPMQISALKRFGLDMGIAFQIQDDVLDIWGNPDVTGKPLFNDLSNTCQNIVIIHALRSASEDVRKYLIGFLGKKNYTREEATEIRNTLEETGSFEYVKQLASAYEIEARGQLAKLKPCIARDDLGNLLQSILSRRA